MKIFYWCPYLTKIATISSVLRSAYYLDQNNKNLYNIGIINACGEWDHIKKNKNFKIYNLLPFNLHNLIPKKGFLSKLSLIYIFIISFFPLIKLIRKEKPKYLIIHLLTSLPIFLSLFCVNTKVILRISGLPKLNILRKFYWKIFSSKIFLVTTPTKLTKDELIKENIFEKKKIKILPDPIIDKKEINNKITYGIKENLKNKSFYIAVGRLTNQKNFEFLINSISEIINKIKIKKIIIIGFGEKYHKLKKLITLKSLEKNIFLLGHKSNPYPYINKAKALISTSRYEDPGFAIIESLYLKTPIISSNCKNGPKEFSKKKIGFFFKSNNKDDFIKKIITFEKKSYQFIKNGWKFSKNYTIENHIRKLKKILL